LWPLVLIGVAVWYRKPVGRALAGFGEGLRLRRVNVGPLGAEFWREAYDTRKELDRVDPEAPHEAPTMGDDSLMTRYEDLASVDPAMAIVRAHGEIEMALRQKVVDAEVEVNTRAHLGANLVARLAFNNGLISANVVPAVEGITAMRNLVLHRQQDVTEQEAHEYLALADGVLFALSQPPRQPG
jgi:hypothetical protein